ncbi:MAG: hypothetical protein ACRDNZ_06405 [Streptosporangiaceae bacterium]
MPGADPCNALSGPRVTWPGVQLPIRDRPLPRGSSTTLAHPGLVAAAGELPGLPAQVCVEALARTGLGKGEFLRLTTNAITSSEGANGCMSRRQAAH